MVFYDAWLLYLLRDRRLPNWRVCCHSVGPYDATVMSAAEQERLKLRASKPLSPLYDRRLLPPDIRYVTVFIPFSPG